MKLQFITPGHVELGLKAILAEEKFLVTDSKTGEGHLPVDDAQHMGAAWAALHGGYRGNKYTGPDKSKAVAKLKALYKSKGMDTPNESYADELGSFFQEALMKDDSYGQLREKVCTAINQNIKLGIDMDCDDDGAQDAIEGQYAYVMDMFPGYAVYSMEGELFQIGYAIDADGDVHLGPPECVQVAYVTTEKKTDLEDESGGVDLKGKTEVNESCALLFEASAASGRNGVYPITVIKPGWSKNTRYYSESMLKKCHKIFEGAKMFADHATDKQAKERPEGSVRDWVASLKNVRVESDGTVKGDAIVIDPAFRSKLDTLESNGLLNEMGVSIRAVGEASDGEAEGKRGKIVESLVAARSVDFVTFAGAGGQVN